MARNWRQIRADVVAKGPLDAAARADGARDDMHDAVRGSVLPTSAEPLVIAGRPTSPSWGVSRARVSEIESGALPRTELGTLQS
ncbi:XRE family transcriptional regulator [soil metagenome]